MTRKQRLLSKKDLSYLLIVVAVVSALPVSGYLLQAHSLTTYGFVPIRTNSTLVLEFYGAQGSPIYERNQSEYRFALDANSTLLFRIYLQQAHGVHLQRVCDLDGQLIYERSAAKFTETIPLGPGYFGYIVCNLNNSTAFGRFQVEVFRAVTTQPYFILGSYIQFLTLPASVWSAFWFIARVARRTKAASAVRIFGWVIVAPFLLLLSTASLMTAIYWQDQSENVGALALTEYAPGLIRIILERNISSGWMMNYLLTSIIGIFLAVTLYSIRVTAHHRKFVKGRTKLHYGILSGPLGRQLGRLGEYILPERPDVSVFSRLAVISLLLLTAFFISPLSFVRELIQPFGPLIPETLSEVLSSFGLVFFDIIVIVPIVGYSFMWKPTPSRSLFRLVRYVYFTIIVISCVVLVSRATLDTFAAVAYVLEYMLPSALLGGYVTCLIEWLMREKGAKLIKTRARSRTLGALSPGRP